MASYSNDVRVMASYQLQEFRVAQALESDLELAYRLQIQEAFSASLSTQSFSKSNPNSTQTSEPDPDQNNVSTFLKLQAEEISKFYQVQTDHALVQTEMRTNITDLKRSIHDRKFAEHINTVPENKWQERGDYIQRAYGDTAWSREEYFTLYFKGLVSGDKISERSIAGLGFAICDDKGNVVLKQRKNFSSNGMGNEDADLEALIECLTAAIALDMKNVNVVLDDHLTYLYITRRWKPAEGKIAELVQQVDDLQKRFEHCNPYRLERRRVKLAYDLAKDAIASEVAQSGTCKDKRGKNITEVCAICVEDVDSGRMFSVDKCMHRYCISCMRQHVVVKLHQARPPNCPHPGCQSNLRIDSCRNFLTHELVELMDLRIKEASIPVTEKVYCPNPRCSALMSASEVIQYSKRSCNTKNAGARKCMKCQGIFCINCKVPWHANMSCHTYKTTNSEDAKLKSLAINKKWRQCVKCKHMIELATGCNHISCRCGYQFCYSCGSEWTNNKPTCVCLLWDENNIVYSENNVKRRRRGG